MSLVRDIQGQFKMQDNALIKIILINILVYVIDCLIWLAGEFSGTDLFVSVLKFQALPSDFFAFLAKPWTLITYAFSHETPSPFHIFFNMVGLYWFGDLIREYINSRRLISLYFMGAFAGAIFYLLAFNLIPFYMKDNQSLFLIGASASVLSIVVGAATLLPDYHFNLVIFGRVKITYIAAFYVFMSFISITGWNAGGNLAHLGGALSGFVFIKLLKKGTDVGKPVLAVVDFTGRLFKRGKKVRMSFLNSAPPVDANYIPNQEEIDLILDKISRSGYESLTKEEKQKLFKASQK
ncbi:MAG: rhomboid family intramembrane serine protease [Cytophagales bacterium]|nr:rhomboid family intramembrane serine protease [Cytophaga sp.]